MKCSTRDMGTALERLASILPNGEVEVAGRGQRTLAFDRPDVGDRVEVTGTTATVLYTGLLACLTAPEHNGFGMERVDVADALRLTKVPQRGLSAHEEYMLKSIVL